MSDCTFGNPFCSQCTTHTFPVALSALRSGSRVTRRSWADGVYIREIAFNGFEPTLVEYCPQPDDNPVGKFPGALLHWEDLIADDWVILES